MNANELADKRHDCQTFTELLVWGMDAEEMLRQQQSEIEALKKQLETSALLNYNKGHEDGRNIALPIKTLADEEIDSIWSEMSEQCDEEFIDMKQFARAILRKASEK